MAKLYGKSTIELKKYVKEAYKYNDIRASKDIYKDYKKSGGKMTYNEIIKSVNRR